MQDSILQLFPQTLPTRIQPSATLRFPVDDVASHVLLALSCACGRLGEGEAACPPGFEGGQRAEILALLTTGSQGAPPATPPEASSQGGKLPDGHGQGRL